MMLIYWGFIMKNSMLNYNTAKITAIITAYRRIDKVINTINRILYCIPAPNEILVHIDGRENLCGSEIRKEFPEITVIESNDSVGPGGGRNKMILIAKNELVASFDDDSYPVDSDFFLRAILLFERFPNTSLIGCYIVHRHEILHDSIKNISRVGSFVGCGVIYRKDAFLRAGGYVALPLAYGMEEEDLALRLLDGGGAMLYSPWLRVFHDTELAHHREPELVAAQIANTALLAFLRYPSRRWPYGAAQTLNRAWWSFKRGRVRGVLCGFLQIPERLWRLRHLRSPVASRTLKLKLGLRRVEMVAFD
jgi:GT2 family glycosyltransferase